MSNEEVYSTVLRKNYANISKKLEFNGSTLLPLMLQEGLITENQKDHIESKATRLQKAEELLGILTRNSLKIPKFTACLRYDHQDALADLIVNSIDEAKAYLKQQEEIQKRDTKAFQHCLPE